MQADYISDARSNGGGTGGWPAHRLHTGALEPLPISNTQTQVLPSLSPPLPHNPPHIYSLPITPL